MIKKLMLSILLLIAVHYTYGQGKLTESRESGHFTRIYRLTEKESFAIALKPDGAISDSFFHTVVDSFYYETGAEYKGKLLFGNYLFVTPVKNQLVYNLHSVQNVTLNFINNLKDVQFTITDLNGAAVTDAAVKIGKNKTVKYDQQAHLYVRRAAPKQKVIRVTHNGVVNYFNFDKKNIYNPYYRDRSAGKRYAGPLVTIKEPDYKGYMVFNKPKYKPLDTVKFKTYVVGKKGKDLKDKTLRIELCESGADEGKVIGTIKPYRKGGYHFNFVLADSLDLDLDENYTIMLKEEKKGVWTKVFAGDFRYEDYELKAVNFSVRTTQTEYGPGNPVTIYLSAKDENELAIPDGRVEATIYTSNITNYSSRRMFIPDSLWSTKLVLDPVGETKLVLPDSIFPKADLNFNIRFTFLNSNNESEESGKYLSYRYKAEKIKSSLQSDSLKLDYTVNGKAVPQNAKLISYFSEKLKADSVQVQLPLLIKLDSRIIKYSIETRDGLKEEIGLSALNPQLNVAAAQTKDSLKVVVTNPQRLPFWYTVFSGNKVLFKGYANRLDTMIRHSGNKMASVKVGYLWAGQPFDRETNSAYNPGQLNIRFDQPDMVYPGQQVKMEVKVTDAAQQAVPFTDITAFAFTAKFKEGGYVNLPDFSKSFTVRKKADALISKSLSGNGQLLLNWEKWAKGLGLDTIAYYQFTHPKEFYRTDEVLKDTSAEVSPFVMLAGNIIPVHVVYIDEIPVFFSKTDQLQHYSFGLRAGAHQIRLRTANHMITLPPMDFAAGRKTILSVAADLKNTKIKVEAAPSELTSYESELLTKYLVSIADNFKEQKTIIEAGRSEFLVNPPTLNDGYDTKLVGPIAENYLKFRSGTIVQPFIKEPGYTYTFSPGLVKQKSYLSAYGFDTVLSATGNQLSSDYKRLAIKNSEIDSIWEESLNLRSATTRLFNIGYVSGNTGKLSMEVDTAFLKKMPYLKNILIYKTDQPEYGQIYPGNTNWFNPLVAGNYRVMYLFKDNRYFIEKDVQITANGQNYFKWNGKGLLPADSLSIKIDRFIKSARQYTYDDNNFIEVKVSEVFNAQYFDQRLLVSKVKGIVRDENKKPVVAAMVKVKGLSKGVLTNARGEFEINSPKKGIITVSFIGYDTQNIVVKSTDLGVITLKTASNELEEVVAIGYAQSEAGSGYRSKKLRSESAVQMIAGAAPGIQVRGIGKAPATSGPIYIVDGVPFTGDISQLQPDDIAQMEVLKAEAATAIYGSRGAAGVVIIKTKKGSLATNTNGELVPQQQTLRTSFSDYAFWQPELQTNAAGMATWNVKFPDDITSWTTAIVAMNGNRQAGQTQTTIKSFKSLSANFVSPQFALEGDSINVIGKLMNYTPLVETGIRKFSYNGQELRNNQVQIKNAMIDTIAIVAKGTDSLTFKYTLEQENGYFDGELRKIPVLPTGVVETKGLFEVLDRDTTVKYDFPVALGKVTVRAEASVFPALLDEMEKLRKYEYLCNEQLASKLKSLLLEKAVRSYMGTSFKREKEIKEIIKKLQLNKTPAGTWGWWANSGEQMWISLHVVEALLKAEQQGYTINVNKDALYNYLVSKLAGQGDTDRIFCVKLIRMLNAKYFIKDWVNAIALQQHNPKNKVEPTLYEKLQLIQLKQLAGMDIDVNAILALKKSTMFGNSYWGQNSYSFWNNSIQNTLLAYQILKTEGKHSKELGLIRRYFLEQRKDGQWRNTYESSLILETILPDLMDGGKKDIPVSLVINGSETVKDFPLNKVIDPAAPLTIRKTGTQPVYFTAFQQFVNAKPEKVSKDFTVKTSFIQNKAAVQALKAGVKTTLKVDVEVRADADYVMIEVPIPAGCSYDGKAQSYWGGVETHREYFKHKTAIFCTKLKAGKYSFDIDLMPRYSGNYLLNPAKAEMMYFPVFYGREGMKRMGIN